MREIKFRAWDNVEDKMYYPGEEEMIHFYFDSYGIVADRFTNIKVQHHDDVYEDVKTEKLEHLIYMQYTGLKDKNGREIYEGDIYSYTMTIDGSHWNEHKVECSDVVKFEDGAFYHGVHLLSDVIEYDETLAYVGNIYENPELIKEVNT